MFAQAIIPAFDAAMAADAIDIVIIIYTEITARVVALRSPFQQQRNLVAKCQESPEWTEVATPEAVIEQRTPQPDDCDRQRPGRPTLFK